jgi:phosphonate transport system substrate-binding protein
MIEDYKRQTLIPNFEFRIANSYKFSRRLLLLQLFLLAACGAPSLSSKRQGLVLGVVSYDAGERTLNRYAKFNQYLSEKIGVIVQLEPAFNENKALERIRNQAWSLAFAEPGLAAIAIAQYHYIPLFPLQGITNLRSILVVRKDNPIVELKELQNQPIALGQPGSATGYFFPIYNLYGLTLAEIMLAPTPKTVLEWVAIGKATAGALSKEELYLHGSYFSSTEFRILYTDPHEVPPGAVLVAPNLNENLRQQIRQIMNQTPSILAQEVGYIPNSPAPDYGYMISVINRVRTIFPDEYERGATPLQLKPARLLDNISI